MSKRELYNCIFLVMVHCFPDLYVWYNVYRRSTPLKMFLFFLLCGGGLAHIFGFTAHLEVCT